MDKPYELTYQLAQQSLLIHFQHDQAGATLRATEVKPKLDRYLLKRLKADNIATDKSWFIGDTQALDYKMRFSQVEFVTEDLGLRTDFDIYYGNMGDNAQKAKGVQYRNSITMTIICLKEPVRSAIRKYIRDFFIVTNFGRMQSKGFGSFIIREKNELTKEEIGKILKRDYGAKKCYSFKSNKKPFKHIKTVYSLMKSGINHNGYRRSLLFEYMHTLNVGNEKAALKQQGVAPAIGSHTPDKNQNDEVSYYVRALMGTGDHVDFLSSTANRRQKTNINIANRDIDRFASTVFFKIIGDRVYYVGKRINRDIFGKNFTFEVKKADGFKPTKYSMRIPTPPENDIFNKDFMDGFLAYCYTELNSQSPKNQGTPLSKLCQTNGLSPVRIEEV